MTQPVAPDWSDSLVPVLPSPPWPVRIYGNRLPDDAPSALHVTAADLLRAARSESRDAGPPPEGNTT